MRKKFARTVAFGLLTTMAATTLLSGCGSSNDGGKGSGSGSDEQVTLTLPVWDSETTPYIADIIEGFEAENPNIKINMVDVAASEYMNRQPRVCECCYKLDWVDMMILASIECIFEKFLHNVERLVYNLARGDLVDNFRWKLDNCRGFAHFFF